MNILGGNIGYNASTQREIERLKIVNDFSFEEKCIGTFIDGKPLYRKMIDFGYLASNETKVLETEIQNIATSYVNLGKSFWYNGTLINFENCNTYSFVYTNWIGNVYTTGSNLSKIAIHSIYPSANEYKAIVCLEYTKTTD